MGAFFICMSDKGHPVLVITILLAIVAKTGQAQVNTES